MWRQNAFPGNSDSDQSISEEEDLNADLQDNCVSLGGHAGREEGLQIQSQLEILRAIHEPNSGTNANNLPYKKVSSFEDEVEMPDFPNEDHLICGPRKVFTYNLDEEVVCDDEEHNALSKYSITYGAKQSHDDDLHSIRQQRQDRAYMRSTVSKEAEALIHLKENALCSSSHFACSKASKLYREVKGRGKLKFSFRFQPHNNGLPLPLISKDEDVSSKDYEVPKRLETIEHGTIGNSSPELLEGLHREKEKQSEIVPVEVEARGCIEHSMVELLDDLQDDSNLSIGNSKMSSRTRTKEKRGKLSPLRGRIIDNKDQPEPMGNRLSSDDETNYQNLKHDSPEVKRQTMADRFQEALGATSMSNEGAFVTAPKSTRTGLFGKLQQIMQHEKERDVDFLKKLQSTAGPNNELSSLDVKIMSRCFDAKLTVCHCSFGKNIETAQRPESPQRVVNKGRMKIIIFNPRVCNNVDLEVGNLIRIHSPWKEVQVIDNGESIILSTYFSHILK